MKVSKRIRAIVDMVSAGHAVCDVGCDHAYTSIALVESGKYPFAVASDVRPGPLAAAEKNIGEAGLAGRIVTCLSDGVPALIHEMLPEGEKTLVISGMGGLLICRILEEAGDNAALFQEMVLSPQSDLDLVRRKLGEMGFALVDEEMLIDEGKFYTIMRAACRAEYRVISDVESGTVSPDMQDVAGKGSSVLRKKTSNEAGITAIGDLKPEKGGSSTFDLELPGITESGDSKSEKGAIGNVDYKEEAEALYGPLLLKKRHPVLREYLIRQKMIMEGILTSLRKAGLEGDGRFKEAERKLEVLHEAERYYENP